jgi:hypothetical protein
MDLNIIGTRIHGNNGNHDGNNHDSMVQLWRILDQLTGRCVIHVGAQSAIMVLSQVKSNGQNRPSMSEQDFISRVSYKDYNGAARTLQQHGPAGAHSTM